MRFTQVFQFKDYINTVNAVQDFTFYLHKTSSNSITQSDKMKRTVADNRQFRDGIQLKKFSVSASISSGNFLLIKE